MTRSHQVILASAGSGKTWRLTTRFLGLLADGVSPERCLATTFTRKAAGEIFTRLLGRLAHAATDDEELGRLNQALQRPPERMLGRADCVDLLARVARALDRFQVRTLDSCFAELAGLFGLDVGLPAGWEVVEEVEDRALRAEAVGAALAGAPAAELAELLHGLHEDRPRRSVHERVLQAVEDGYAVWLDRRDDAAWECAIKVPEGLSPEDAAALPGRLAALEPPLTKAGEPRVGFVKAQAALLEALNEQRWGDLLDSTIVCSVLDGSCTYSGIALEEQWRAVLEALGRHAGRACAARLLQRCRSQRRLLQRFDTEYRRLQHRRRALRFDDLPRALATATFDLDGQGAALRVGRRVEHLLLDEFQDTSVLQWRVLAPLSRAILREAADSRSFFCVGDVKQAIYAWREGESRLLRKLADGSCGPVSVLPLSTSYRSSPAVLGLVNSTFERLPENAVFDGDPVLVRAAQRWARDFQPHQLAPEKPAATGAARLIEVPMEGEGTNKRAERTRQLMRFTALHVRSLVQEAPGAEIAVLLRRGAPAAQLLYELEALGVAASGEGGNPLTDSASVRLALSLLRLAEHPGDTAARFHLETSPLAAALGLQVAGGSDGDSARGLGRNVRAALSERGHGEWLSTFERDVLTKADFEPWERGRFRQLVELGLRWDARGADRTGDFVDHVRLTGVEDPTAARVRVMTIHAAKGLEFDAVVLPDLENDLVGSRDGLVALRPDPEGPIETIFPRPSQGLRVLLPELAAGCEAADERTLEESLCVLYVALTRAKRRLDVLVPQHVRSMHSATFAGLLRHALLGANAYAPVGPDRVLWTAPGTVEEWFALETTAAAPTMANAAAPARLTWSPGESRTRPRRSPSLLVGGSRIAAADLLSLDGRAASGRGVLVHRWLEELEWIDDFAAGDEALLAAGQEVSRREGLSLADQRSHLAELRRWLTRPATRALFDRDATRRRLGLPAGPDLTLDVQRERRFVVPDGDALLAGAMDRVVLARRGSSPLCAEIVDFKTDRLGGASSAAALDELVEHYRPQMQAYRRALCALTGLAPETVACRLLFLDADAVREV